MHIRSLFEKSLSEMNPVVLDLSANNERIQGINLDDQTEFEAFIQHEIALQHGGCGIGGYLENRIVYRRSAHYENGPNTRCIHLGVDIWTSSACPFLLL